MDKIKQNNYKLKRLLKRRIAMKHKVFQNI